VLVVAGYGGPIPIRSAVYVDTRTGQAGQPVFRERLPAGWDTSGWEHGFSADAETVDMITTVLALAVNRQGTRPYSAGDDGAVTAWDLTARDGFGAQIRTPRVVGVDPDELIAIGDPVLTAPTGNWVLPVQQWGGPASQGPILAVFVDPRTRETVGSVRASVRAPVGWPRQTASLNPDGRLVAITTMFSTAVIDVGRRQVIHQVILPTVPAAVASDGETVRGVPEPIVASTWSADGRRLLLATGGARGVTARGSVVVVDTATWSASRVLPPGDATAIAASPDGRVLAVGYASGDVDIADAARTGCSTGCTSTAPSTRSASARTTRWCTWSISSSEF
jgi:hypothetical protein